MVQTSPSNMGVVCSIPGQGVKIPHVLWPKKQNINNRLTLGRLPNGLDFLTCKMESAIILASRNFSD